jgi:hypothetical protein
MSMTLLLWKAPVVADSDEAEVLLQPYYDRSDDTAFEPSPDVAKVAGELRRRFPESDDGPWGDSAPEENDRILFLSIRWGADNAVIDAITELAREHELILYDPQGPDVHLPDDPVEPEEPASPPKLMDYLWLAGMALIAAGVFWLGWRIDVPVLGWVLMIAGGFFFTVIMFMFRIFLFPSKDESG